MLLEIAVVIVLKLTGSDYYEAGGALVGALFALVYNVPISTHTYWNYLSRIGIRSKDAEKPSIVVSGKTFVRAAIQSAKSGRLARIIGLVIGWFIGHNISTWLDVGPIGI